MTKRKTDLDFDNKFEKLWTQSEGDKLDIETRDTLYGHIQKYVDPPLVKVDSRSRFSNLVKYAAIFIGVIMTVGLLYFYSTDYLGKSADLELVNLKVIKAESEKKTIVLNDSSTVALFAYSTLTFPEHFNGVQRKVTLEGSAYFDVRENTDMPFVVHSGQLVSKVLGTTFTIFKDTLGSDIKITLHSGKLEVSKKDLSDKKILFPGDYVVYDTIVGDMKKSVLGVADPIIMAEDVIQDSISISFESIKIKEAYELLDGKIGVTIDHSVIRPERNMIISLDFKNKTVDRILNDLNSFGGYSYVIKDNMIFIKE